MRACSRLAVLAAAFLVGTGAIASAALVPHRAVYDLAVDDTRSLDDGAAAFKGRMVYEFTGSSCAGWSVNFRFVLESRADGGEPSTTDMRTTNFETADGALFRFTSRTYTNEVVTEDVAGEAKRGADALTVTVDKPDNQTLSLPRAAVFPSDHLARIIEAARRGERILALETYDGSDGGTHLYRTTTVIGDPVTEPPVGDEMAIGTATRWPVVVSYFDTAKSGDLTPDYAAGFLLWDNGVSTRMRLDYGDFALKGDMVRFDALPATDDCKAPAAPAEAPRGGVLSTPPAVEGAPSQVTPP